MEDSLQKTERLIREINRLHHNIRRIILKPAK